MSRGFPRFGILLYLAGSMALAIIPAVTLPGIAHAAATLGSGSSRPADPSWAADPSPAPLASLLLESADLPVGFRPYAPLTGRLDAKRARALGMDLSRSGLLGHTWIHDWWSASTQTEVRDLVADAGTRETAEGAAASFDSTALQQGMARAPLPGTHFVGFRETIRRGHIDYLMLTLSIARGPYLFALTVLTPVQSSSSGYLLMSRLASAQSHKVPNDTPDTEASDSEIRAQIAGGLIGGLIVIPLIYLCILSVIAYLQNPLRGTRRRGRPQRARRQMAGPEVKDVSKRARNNRRMAQIRLAVQCLGGLIAGISVSLGLFLVPAGWYIFLLVGSIIIWAAGRYIQPGGSGRGKHRMALSGHRKFRVAVLLSAASAMIILGYGILVNYAVISAGPEGTATAAFSQLPNLGLIGLLLVSAGAICHRYARRLGSVEAHRLMLEDSRQAVLYLRSFGDDGLKLWTATLGRHSFIERFTPSRFDAFEEVLARHLSFAGPVVAVNAPGTSLPPLGAARETIDSADWQSTIATWMDESALIVFVVPPEHVTPGLLWELETVTTHGQWAKTLIVVPPVQPENLDRRWTAFFDAAGKLWPFTLRPPVHDPPPLLLAFRDNAWTVITARRRNEWAYGAALHQAWTQFKTGQGPHAEGRPSGLAGDHRAAFPII